MKLGFYPLPVEHGPRIRARLAFPNQLTTALDPCAGAGAALKALTADSKSELFGVELDSNRAEQASRAGLRMIQGNLFDVRGRVERLSLIYVNPPYDFEIGPLANKRMERLFLGHTYSWLKPKGILVMVIPGNAVVDVADTLGARFRDVRVYRMEGEASRQYDQYAVFGIRHNNSGRDAETISAAIKQEMVNRRNVPVLDDIPDVIYQVPPSTDDVILTHTGIPLDVVEDRLRESAAWHHAIPLLLPRQEVAGGRPITPLHGGHVGLLATAGMLNGVFGSDDQKHIARWRPVKHTTTITEIEGDEKVIRTKERFSNELALVFVTGKTFILTETPKKAEDEIVAVTGSDEAEASEDHQVENPDFSDPYDMASAMSKDAPEEKDFVLGKIVLKAAVREWASYEHFDLFTLLIRHSQSDWGDDLSPFDRRRNEEAVNSGDGRILSSYVVPESPEGIIWIITQADRSVTTICFPSER
jgi:hypothetical protein